MFRRDKDGEWQQTLLMTALERVKRRVSPDTFQIFDLHALREMAAREVAKLLGTNIARVYLAQHRVKSMLAKEIRELELAGSAS